MNFKTIIKADRQVCTLDQAKRFQEIGVQQNSLFYWRHGHVQYFKEVNSWNDKETLGGMIEHYNQMNGDTSWMKKYNIFSAFTTSELGQVLDNYKQGLESIREENQAKERAERVLYLFNNGIIDTLYINRRLMPYEY